MKKTSIYLVLIFSIAFNLVFYVIGIHPVIVKKLFNDDYMGEVSVKYYKDKLLDAGLKMAASQKTVMPFGDYTNFLVELRKVFNKNERDIYFEYNFPKAYLMNGLLEYAINNDDMPLINKIKNVSDKYIEDDGVMRFEFNKVDQSVFGLSFINLHKIYGDEKYKIGANYIYNYIIMNLDSDRKLILYRKGNNKQFVDVLGMVVPFLIQYGTVYNDSKALDIAYRQILFYMQNGLEEHSHFPFHAINLESNLRLGPANWGRGVGWYAIALGWILHYTSPHNNPHYFEFEKEMNSLHRNLIAQRTNKYWGQFITGSENDKIDTSTTTMLFYSFGLAGKEIYSDEVLVNVFSQYTNSDGYLDFTSGDTYTVNRYAKEYGKSELSQGLLLSLFGLN